MGTSDGPAKYAAPEPELKYVPPASEVTSKTSLLRLGPYSFNARIKDIKNVITEMINSLPNSHMIRGPGNITRCANKQFVFMQMKTVAEAEILLQAWAGRDIGFKECKLVSCRPEEVLSALGGNGA